MATFNITSSVNLTDLSGKTGNDVYNINGGSLLQNSDSRYGPNCSLVAGYGNLTISGTLGGTWTISGKDVYVIPFQSGSGTVPAYSTSITQGLSSGSLLCVMSDRWGGTIYLPGQTMPSTGYIKIRNKLGNFDIGALQNINAFCIGQNELSFVLVAGCWNKTFTIPRLGSFNIDGDFWHVGVTNGSAGQVLRLPHMTAELRCYYPLVEVETAPASGEYIQYHNAGIRMLSSGVGTDTRSRLVYISDQGEVYFGTGYDGSICGHVPVSGCRVRIPNVVLQTCGDTVSTYSTNPQLTSDPATRYEAVYSSAGTLVHTCSTGWWYWNINQPYSVNIRHLHTCDKMNITEVSSEVILDEIHVAPATMASDVTTQAFTLQQCYFGGTIGRISSVKARCTGTSHYAAVLVNLYGGFTFEDFFGRYTENATVVAGPAQINTCKDLVFDVLRGIGKRIIIQTCKNVLVKNLIKADNQFGTTVSSVPSRAIEVAFDSFNVYIETYNNWDNLPDVHPYESIMLCNTAQKVRLRNIGSPSSPLNAGTSPSTRLGYVFQDNGNNEDIKVQRVWTTPLRTGIYSTTNTSKGCILENIYCEDTTKACIPNNLNSLSRGNRHNSGTVLYAYTSVYGTHFWDGFISDTATRFAIAYTEPTTSSASQCTIVSGTPKFTAQGELVMANVGDCIVWEQPYFMLGWLGLSSWGVSGTNQITKHTYEYDIDRGNGFSGTYKELSNPNLTAEQAVSPTTGFRFRIKTTCSVSDPNNKLRAFYIDGTTSKTVQDQALYPLDILTIALTGLVPGSSCAIFDAATYADGQDPVAFVQSGTTAELIFPKQTSDVYLVRVRKAGYGIVELQTTMTSDYISIPVFQVQNRDGFGVQIYGRGPGTTKPYVTVNYSQYRLDIGNFRVTAEDLYDLVTEFQATRIGISYPEIMRFDGIDGLLMNQWRLRRAQLSHTNAGVDFRVFVDGSNSGSPDDEVNGSIDILAKTVRTYNTSGQITMTKEDIAQAVWAYLQSNGLSAESNLLATKLNASNAFAAAVSLGD